MPLDRDVERSLENRRDGAEWVGRTFASSLDVARHRFPRARRRGFERWASRAKDGDGCARRG